MKLFLQVHAENGKGGYMPTPVAGGLKTAQVNTVYRPKTQADSKKLNARRHKFKANGDGTVTKVTTGKTFGGNANRGGGAMRVSKGSVSNVPKALKAQAPLRGRNAKKDRATRQGALQRAKSIRNNPRAGK